MTWSVSSYSATPASNTAINGINIAENCNASGINDAIRQMMADIATFSAGVVPPNYVTGLTLSTAGSSATFAVAAGAAADSTNAGLMTLAASISKTTSAWAVGSGNGALDTGAIANTTWYHVWEIKRPDTGVVDVLISLSATAPTMPTNYTLKRRIGSMKTNGSSQWIAFTQIGGWFFWTAEVIDVLNSTCISAPTNYALSAPPGVVTIPQITIRLDFSGGVTNFCVGPGGSTGSFTVMAGNAGTAWIPITTIPTDTSRQIVIAANSTAGQISIFNIGYYDFRGQ